MISIALVLFFARADPEQSGTGDWAYKVLHSPKAAAALASARRERTTTPNISTQIVHLPSPSHSRAIMFDPTVTAAGKRCPTVHLLGAPFAGAVRRVCACGMI